jgi:hypothetical protein
MVAVGLIYGQLTADHYDEPIASDPRIDALRQLYLLLHRALRIFDRGLQVAAAHRLHVIRTLNVAGRGEPMTFAECIRMANSKLIRVPGKWAFKSILKLLWASGISAIPPAAMPYMTGQYIMQTERLRNFLSADYEQVIRYTIRDAFADCFAGISTPVEQSAIAS